MTLQITEEKADKIVTICTTRLNHTSPTIREVAQVIGNLVAAFPAVPYGQLYYRELERCKIKALAHSAGNFDSHLVLTAKALCELRWWIDNIRTIKRPIHPPDIDFIIHSDASKMGWGSTEGTNPTGGRFSYEESNLHINIQELMAAKFSLMSYCSKYVFNHVRFKLDNSTAIAYINHMGVTKSLDCNNIAVEIWQWCISKNIWISAAFIPGTNNTIADKKSRDFDDNTEWTLDYGLFQKICVTFFKPDIDLMASRLNNKCEKYISWHPDPYAFAVDAFSEKWANMNFYCFPPFSLIGKVLAKINHDQANGILIVPVWTTQAWFPVALRMVVVPPLILPQIDNLVFLPFNKLKKHPLRNKLRLMALHLSGIHSQVKEFQTKLKKLSCLHGGKPLVTNTNLFYENGKNFVLNEVQIPTIQM